MSTVEANFTFCPYVSIIIINKWDCSLGSPLNWFQYLDSLVKNEINKIFDIGSLFLSVWVMMIPRFKNYSLIYKKTPVTLQWRSMKYTAFTKWSKPLSPIMRQINIYVSWSIEWYLTCYLLLKMHNLILTTRKYHKNPNWGSFYKIIISYSLKCQDHKRLRLFQIKIHWRDMTMKCKMWSWIRDTITKKTHYILLL